MIKCPYDKLSHHMTPENLPVNYQVLTALPMGVQNNTSTGEEVDPTKEPKSTIRFCDIHP